MSKTTIKPERLYCTLLALMGVYILCGIALLVALAAIPPEARPRMQWPEWLLPLLAFLNGGYFCAMVVTLVLRRVEPSAGRRLTKALNIGLLFGPPFGTLLGLYGLWKVDRNAPETPG